LTFRDKDYIFPVHAMNFCMGVEELLQTFLNAMLGGGEWPASRHCSFTFRRRALVDYQMGGWIGPTVGLDILEMTSIF
jgi:hypothetical protein